jgi:opacity protein-like surface antigen
MMKQALTAAALAVVLASPAFAQDTKTDMMPKPGATTKSPADQATFMQNQDPADWRGSKLIGATVYGPDNASIGDINDVLIAKDGKINAVVIGVGGFLGVGEKHVAVPFEKLNVTRRPDSASIAKITVSYSKDQLSSAPQFAYYAPAPAPRSTTTGSGGGLTTPRPPATAPAR